MKESLKVQPHHLERGAYLYIRQSSMRQVVENVESTKRQYALRGRATALGWRDEQIIVVDNDQGESGASAAWRDGFQRLVSDVGIGRAGIVMGLEVSRLARNNADWQRLLEICALADTLILVEDGVYDPTSFNDRLLLGLKGTMSEAELHVIKARLRGGILNKVRRGEYRCTLPTGLIYDQSGNVTLDPDTQVRETIAHFFDTFSRVGSACQTVKAFRKEGLLFPSRLRNSQTTVFRPLNASTAIRVLNNPRYAGCYVYGVLDEAVRERLIAMTVDFSKLWADPDTPDRERKRLLAHVIEDVTLVKMPVEGTTKIHVRFKGGKIQTLTTMSPKSSAQQVKTPSGIVELVDKLLDKHIYSEIAELLNEQGYRPGGSARRGRHDARFTALLVAYLVHRYGLRPRYDRLRDRGMLTKREAAARLNIHETTLARWAEHGLVTRHAYNAHYCLYEIPASNPPRKQCSRWNRLVDRAAAFKTAMAPKPSTEAEGAVV